MNSSGNNNFAQAEALQSSTSAPANNSQPDASPQMQGENAQTAALAHTQGREISQKQSNALAQTQGKELIQSSSLARTQEASRTAFVTGGSQGIGEAIALCLAQQGWNVAISCSNPDSAATKGEAVAAQCRKFGVEAQCYSGDVSSFAACEQMVKQIAKELGGIDLLVNNAGITKDGLIARMKEEQFDRVIEVNLKGCFNTIRHVSPLMIRKRAGRIINISSVVGLYGNAGQFNYAASKAGVIGMTKTAAKELGSRGITVNAIAPGFIETPMTDALPDRKSVV